MTYSDNKKIYIWLFCCAFLVVAMVFLGGITRLTHSGLAIVEWRPITGIIPPMTQGDWQQEFAKYQQIPEFRQINYTMQLADFKFIYLMEYAHRLLGRVVGCTFVIPFLYLACTKRLARAAILKLSAVAVGIGLQGFVGWYMVKSGLVARVDISQYRLALHLDIAFLIYTSLVWIGLSCCNIKKVGVEGQRKYAWYSIAGLVLIFLQVTSGAFVAGLDAGLTYNSFPLMDGQIIPDGLFSLRPWYINFFENITLVQFMHRCLAMTLALYLVFFAKIMLGKILGPKLKFAVQMLIIVLILQLGLGISTLLLHVPIALASLHQLGAILLFTVMLYITYILKR